MCRLGEGISALKGGEEVKSAGICGILLFVLKLAK